MSTQGAAGAKQDDRLLRQALALLAWHGWTLEAAMADPLRSRILLARANQLLKQKRRAKLLEIASK